MRIRLLFAFIIGVSFTVSAQKKDSTVQGVSFLLKEISFDFGKIPHGRPVRHDFELINNGTDTLKLEKVQASCGCTTPIWKADPVAPGKSTKIEVGFNAGMEGPFEKTVNIFYNGNKNRSLIIKGNVYKGPATSVPLNSSVKLLKEAN